MAGKFIPGQPSSIREFASELGTSSIPVREALRRLVTEKTFEIHANGSIVVPIMTRTRFHDLQQARILIEGFATELAAGSIVNGGAKRDHCGGVKRDRLAAAGLSP